MMCIPLFAYLLPFAVLYTITHPPTDEDLQSVASRAYYSLNAAVSGFVFSLQLLKFVAGVMLTPATFILLGKEEALALLVLHAAP